MCRHRVMLVLSYNDFVLPPSLRKKKKSGIRQLAGRTGYPARCHPQTRAGAGAKGITIELFCTPGEIPSARFR